MNFSVTSEYDTSLQLSWNEPLNVDGEIDHYIVRIKYYTNTMLCSRVNKWNISI